MSCEPLEPPRSDPPITVEAAPIPDAAAPDWTEPVLTGTARDRCRHRVRFHDLNEQGRGRAGLAFAAISLTWGVITIGAIVGLAIVPEGVENADRLLTLGGLILVCSALLQAVGAVGLGSVLRRLHRPGDIVIGLAAAGYLLFLLVLVLLLTAVEPAYYFLVIVAALPFAAVLWQLIALRNTLYGRGTCRTHPGFPPAIRALLKHDPGPFAVMPEPTRFRVADCPHRLEFGRLRRRYQVMSLVNTALLLGYLGAMLVLMAALVARREFAAGGPGYEATALALAVLLPLINLPAFQEVNVRSQRYHRAPFGLYIGAFIGYALSAATGIWGAIVLGGPMSLIPTALAAYWAFSAVVAMTGLPPRSECGSLREPPLVIRKMLKA